ncbi:hypothetical protein F4827_005832 [Paraburkholderia bannensis]|uniref:Uncharacterized protein n=1 Tax=Paraburkholderia bannensis TaxID=765414 RepID=A0A7W9U2R2_9BURK|nr:MULTISPECIES: hypothetical protein [Paraburkholderia]MBB3260925.1 hypothetical protein [Paraburkholderia sp. WP4_3_2]MBB6105962.1 hypothetical protein [Paraburkholderia bannensis]
MEAVPEKAMLGTGAFEALAYGLRPAFAILEGRDAKSANVCAAIEECVYVGRERKTPEREGLHRMRGGRAL